MEKTSFGTPEQRGNVTIYPALPAEILRATRGGKKKVAAYVRVSTVSVQQETSLVLQKEYYENFIKNNSEYEFVEIYGDDGVSGTSMERREGLKKMLEDCKAGKIDLILIKSISRFARNVGDLLSSINTLNALNPPVEIRFEVENISTFSPMGEMLITVCGIMAQWESQIKSETITWAIDKLFAQGKYYAFPLLGYDKEKGRDNPLTINEEEAKTVRLCYAMTVMGCSFAEIAKMMNELGLKSRLGNIHWTASGVKALLSNEKYAGHLLARKTVTPNYKTHKPCDEDDKDSLQWSKVDKHNKIVPRMITGKAFTAQLFTDMKWNFEGTIKMLGVLLKCKDEKIFVFNLMNAEAYFRLAEPSADDPNRHERVPLTPSHWQGHYGQSYEESKTPVVTTFEGIPEGFVKITLPPLPPSKKSAISKAKETLDLFTEPNISPDTDKSNENTEEEKEDGTV